jgi:glycerol-3-phosphate acyltransferase PlsY
MMNILLYIGVIVIIGYLIGSLHGSYIAQKLSGINVKENGIKNSGASNATIVLGWKYGLLVAVFDIGKGFLAVFILSLLTSSWETLLAYHNSLLFLMSFMVVIGHNYPVWMKFNGGKGTAAVIGVLLAIDWQMGLIGLFGLVLISLITDYLLIGVLFLYMTLCGYSIWFSDDIWSIIIAFSLFTLAIWKHQENISRLKAGTEPRVSHVLKFNDKRTKSLGS